MDRSEMRQRILQRRKSVRFAELRQLIEAYGFELDRIRGSHHIFKRGAQRLIVPVHGIVKVVYVDQALRYTAGEDEDDSIEGGD